MTFVPLRRVLILSAFLLTIVVSGAAAQWEAVPYPADPVNSRKIRVIGDDIYIANEDFVIRSLDNGVTWQYLVKRDGGLGRVRSIVDISGTIFISTRETVYRLVDTTWARADSGLPLDRDDSEIPMLFSDGGTLIVVYLNTNMVYRSSDMGMTWQPFPPLPEPRLVNASANGGALYVTTANRLFRLSETGDAWIDITTGLPSSGRLETLLGLGETVFIGGEDIGINRSTDGGQTWTRRPEDGIDTTSDVVTLAARGPLMLAAVRVKSGPKAGEHLMASTDGGVTWQFNTYWFLPVDIAFNDTYVWGLTGGSEYLLRRPIGEVFQASGVRDMKEEERGSPALAIEGEGAPFRIRGSMPAAGAITLNIHDMQGREVARLLDDHAGAGPFSITFDPSGLPGGVYLVRMGSGGHSVVRALLWDR